MVIYKFIGYYEPSISFAEMITGGVENKFFETILKYNPPPKLTFILKHYTMPIIRSSNSHKSYFSIYNILGVIEFALSLAEQKSYNLITVRRLINNLEFFVNNLSVENYKSNTLDHFPDLFVYKNNINNFRTLFLSIIAFLESLKVFDKLKAADFFEVDTSCSDVLLVHTGKNFIFKGSIKDLAELIYNLEIDLNNQIPSSIIANIILNKIYKLKFDKITVSNKTKKLKSLNNAITKLKTKEIRASFDESRLLTNNLLLVDIITN